MYQYLHANLGVMQVHGIRDHAVLARLPRVRQLRGKRAHSARPVRRHAPCDTVIPVEITMHETMRTGHDEADTALCATAQIRRHALIYFDSFYFISFPHKMKTIAIPKYK